MDSQDKARLLRSFSEKFGIEEVVCLNNGEQLPIEELIEWVYEKKHLEGLALDERKLNFGLTLKPFYVDGIYPRKLLATFFDYWTEPDKKGKKMRFEYEKTWSLNRRLKTFALNSKYKIQLPPSEFDTILDGDNAKKVNEPISHENLFH